MTGYRFGTRLNSFPGQGNGPYCRGDAIRAIADDAPPVWEVVDAFLAGKA